MIAILLLIFVIVLLLAILIGQTLYFRRKLYYLSSRNHWLEEELNQSRMERINLKLKLRKYDKE